MKRIGTPTLAVILMCIALPGSRAGAQTPPPEVTLRGDREPVAGAIEKVTAEGITVKEGAGASRLIGWDRVRSVKGQHEAEAAEFASVMDRSWRARSRMERSDFAGAEPMLEELFSTFRTAGGPTAAVVDEGLMRCRLARGSPGTAIWPWLSLVATVRDAGAGRVQVWIGGTIGAGGGVAPAIGRGGRSFVRDESTDLVGALPPMFVGDRPTAALVAADEWEAYATGNAIAAELAGLYRAAAMFEISGGLGTSAVPVLATKSQADHPGVRLVTEIVVARVGDKEQRRAARTQLEQRVRSALAASSNAEPASKDPPWLEAWCRAAIGRSLLREDDPKDRRRGITELLHVPARYADSLPHLAALALAESAAAMKELGDPISAAILVRELRARYPGHPVLEWDRLDGIAPASPAEKEESGGSASASAQGV